MSFPIVRVRPHRVDEGRPHWWPAWARSDDDRLVHLDFDADISMRPKSGPQVRHKPVVGARVRIVAANAELRRRVRERHLPLRGQAHFARARGVVQETDIGHPDLVVQGGREAVRGDMDHEPSTRERRGDPLFDLDARRQIVVGENPLSRSSRARLRTVFQYSRGCPIERFRSTTRRVTVEATTGALSCVSKARSSP